MEKVKADRKKIRVNLSVDMRLLHKDDNDMDGEFIRKYVKDTLSNIHSVNSATVKILD